MGIRVLNLGVLVRGFEDIHKYTHLLSTLATTLDLERVRN